MSPFRNSAGSAVFRLFIVVTFVSNLWLVVDFEIFKNAVASGMVALVNGNQALLRRVDQTADLQAAALKKFADEQRDAVITAESERKANWDKWNTVIDRIDTNVNSVMEQTKQTRDDSKATRAHASAIAQQNAHTQRATRSVIKQIAKPPPRPWFHIP